VLGTTPSPSMLLGKGSRSQKGKGLCGREGLARVPFSKGVPGEKGKSLPRGGRRLGEATVMIREEDQGREEVIGKANSGGRGGTR